jgi:hypothetical protein
VKRYTILVIDDGKPMLESMMDRVGYRSLPAI